MVKVHHEPLEIQSFYGRNYTPYLVTEILEVPRPNRLLALSNIFRVPLSFFKRCRFELKISNQATTMIFLLSTT